MKGLKIADGSGLPVVGPRYGGRPDPVTSAYSPRITDSA